MSNVEKGDVEDCGVGMGWVWMGYLVVLRLLVVEV